MPARLWVTNTTTDPESGAITPASLPVGTSWVGNLYTKNNGAVQKYLIKTPWTMPAWIDTGETDAEGEPIFELTEVDAPGKVDLTGLPGVFGPIDPATIQAALDADGGTTKGWNVPDVPEWAISGSS